MRTECPLHPSRVGVGVVPEASMQSCVMRQQQQDDEEENNQNLHGGGGDPLVGRLIAGRFEIEAFLRAGAMGAIYRARHVSLDKIVCIKILHRELASDSQFAVRFHREAKAASRLDHPCSLRVLDFGEEPDGVLYIAMEYLDGRDLLEVLEQEWPLPRERIVDIVSQTLAALTVAHNNGILHRDLKPENIMIVPTHADDGQAYERVKVCDFGIAQISDPTSTKTEADDDPSEVMPSRRRLTVGNGIIGTPEYMSPEQARGEVLDARSDLYSVGAVLYHMLTGRLPFEADTPLGVVLKQINDEPLAPSAVMRGSDVDPLLESICMRALQKRRSDRWGSAREMRAALLEMQPTSTPTPTPTPTPTSIPNPPTSGRVLVSASSTSSSSSSSSLISERSNVVVASLKRLVEGAADTLIEPPRPWGSLREAKLGRAMVVVVAAFLSALGAWFFHATMTTSRDASASASTSASTSTAPSTPPSVVTITTLLVPTSTEASSPSPVVEDVSPPPPSMHPTTTRPAPFFTPAPKTAAPASRRVEAPASPQKEVRAETTEPGPAVAPVTTLTSATTPAASPPTAPSPPPPPPQPTAAAVTPPPPSQPATPPAIAIDKARVEIGPPTRTNGATSVGFQRALLPVSVRATACYRDALPKLRGAPEGSGVLHVETNDVGVITHARVDGAFRADLGDCIAKAALGGRVPNVDTGTASAEMPLAYRLR